jgi:hypothetical protein
MSGVNNTGIYWSNSGSTGSGLAYRLDYNSTALTTLTGQAALAGYAVRCVRNSYGNVPLNIIMTTSATTSGYIKLISGTNGEVIYDRLMTASLSVNETIYIPPDTYTFYVFRYSSTETGFQSQLCDNSSLAPGQKDLNTLITSTYNFSYTVESAVTYTWNVIMSNATMPLCAII